MRTTTKHGLRRPRHEGCVNNASGDSGWGTMVALGNHPIMGLWETRRLAPQDIFPR